MSDDFYLDEPAFDGVTDEIVVTGTNLNTSYNKLNGVLLATQGCWGHDDIGKAFEKNYWGNAEKVRTGMEGAGDALTETGRTVRKTAADLADLDVETAKVIDSEIVAE